MPLLQTGRRARARQLADYHKDLVDSAIKPLRQQIEESDLFGELQTRMALAALDVGAVNLVHLSLNDPISDEVGRLVTNCQLDPESAHAGLVILCWYKLVTLHDDTRSYFKAEEFCRAMDVDEHLKNGFVEMETSWGEMVSGTSRVGTGIWYILLRLYKERVQRRTDDSPNTFENMLFVELMFAMDQTIGSYFVAMVNDREMGDVRGQVSVYKQFMLYKGVK